jgi:hypothetical protein
MSLGTLGSTLNDELNRLANGGTYRDMDDMVDEALAAKQWANRENISPYTTDTVGVLNEIAGLGTNRQNWLDFNGVCNYIAGTSGLPAAAALRQIYPTTDLLTNVAPYYVDAANNSVGGGYLYLPGIAGNYASAPDSAALDITTTVDIRAKIAPNNWFASGSFSIVSKWNGTGNQRSYSFLLFDGFLRLQNSSTGSNVATTDSTRPVPFLNGQTGWVRVVHNTTTTNIDFYTSTDGINWTQLGTTITGALSVLFSSTALLEIGARDAGTAVSFSGEIFRAQVRSGVDGTIAFDANFETAMTSQSVTSFTESSANAATVTVNRTTTDLSFQTINNLGNAGSLLPITLGSSTAIDSNDPKFLDHTGTNYVYTPGVASNFLSVPDEDALDITGDIDLRWYGALDDWTPAALSCVLSKWVAGQLSYTLNVTTTGALQLFWTTDGTTSINKTSTANIAVADGSLLWVRATLDVDNTASGNDVKFFTSTNGTTWTQLGTTVTTAGVTSIYSGTALVNINAASAGAAQSLAGKAYRAQILDGIDGTTVLDVDTSVITTGAATSFTAVTGQTVTINRSTSGRKTVAVTQPTWLFGTDDYMEVNNRYMTHSTAAENYVYLSGANSNNMTVADNPPLDITSDIDIRVKVALDDWTTPTQNTFVSKEAPGDRAYAFYSVGGALYFSWSPDGSTQIVNISTVTYTPAAGTVSWIRATLDIDNGAGGNTGTFYTSSDGVTWTQLGATSVRTGTTSIYSGAMQVAIGSRANNTSASKGKIFRAQILSGIDGTIVLDADASVITLPSQTTFVDRSSNAYTVTINKSGVGTFVSTGNYMYVPGIASNFASAPDAAPLDITGDIDIRCKVALDDWTPSATNTLVAKTDGSTNISYSLQISNTGVPRFVWSETGSAIKFVDATVGPTVTDGSTIWLRVTLDVDNGAAGNTVTFFTSNDGLTWTQLGSPVVTLVVTSIYNGTTPINIGAQTNGTVAPARGKFFRAQVLNGINGTLVFDANFESSITSLLQTSFTESSTNGATVTINRSGSTFRSAGVIDAGYLYPGATNTFALSTTDFLNFGATDSFTLVMGIRTWATSPSSGRLLDKRGYGATAVGPGYFLYNNSTLAGRATFDIIDINGTNVSTGSKAGAYTLGNIDTLVATRDVSSDALQVYNNTVAVGTPTTDTTTGSLSSTTTLRIGTSGSNAQYNDIELYSVAIFRSVLTTAQIRQITNYFTNREAYL